MNESKNIFWEWFYWQFVQMPKFLLQAWNNYILFALDYFSLPVLIRSFFSPWHKYRWFYPKRFDPVEFFNTLVSNFFSRVVGAFMRIWLILAGIIFQIFVFLAGLFVFLLWILIPFLAMAGFLFFFLN